MKKFVFSLHALNKIEILKKHQIFLELNIIQSIIEEPDKIEKGYKHRLFAQGTLDDKHVLRIVYEKMERILKS